MPLALITGATSGIGWHFAVELARRGYDLIAIGRQADSLAALQQKTNQIGVNTVTIAQDLTADGAIEAIVAQLQLSRLDLLINNAGVGSYGEFLDSDWRSQQTMIQLNVMALTQMTYLMLPYLIEAQGDIINVASISAYTPMPKLAVYGATKAFVLSFSQALWAELQDKNVKILAVCPGAVKTKFYQRANWSLLRDNSLSQQYADEPATIAIESLNALQRNQISAIPGNWFNQLTPLLSNVVPQPLWLNLLKQQL